MWPPSRHTRRALLAAVAASLAWAFATAGQDQSHGRYLDRLGLEDIHAEYLLDQLQNATGSERTELARQLSAVYLELLQDDSNPGNRQAWAERAATLLRVAPEADSPGLRLGLAQAAYLKAEEIAERNVLLLATERDIADAQRVLREVGPTFVGLAQQAHRDAERLERELSKQHDRETEDQIAADLAEARRIRSIAFYFAGWSSYYTAELTGNRQAADQALRHFGWILGARDGSEATVDQLQSSLLRFDHVARSAIGAAMACSLSGRTIEARAWLDAVARSTETSEEIRSSLVARRIRVLAQSDAWPDINTIARRAYASEGDVDATFARLVCILAFDRLGTAGGSHQQLVRRLAEDTIAELIGAGEIGHVTDLARRYGTELLGESGFVANYVRAVMQEEEARNVVERHGSDDPRSATALLGAAESLAAASSAEDADRFPRERARALYQAGQALFEARRLAEAGELFEQSQALAVTEERRRQAAWMRVVTLDRAVENGDASLGESRDEAALLFLAAFPASDEAAQLALRPSTARLLTEGQAVEILLGVPRSAPTFAAARRRAAALLYRRYRSAGQLERPLAAEQFMSLSEELIAQDGVALRSMDSAGAREVADAMVLNARRLADVSLALQPPDIDRAVFAIETIERALDFGAAEQDGLADELRFRRLQIASHQGRLDTATRLADELAVSGSAFADTAARVMYRDSVRVWLEDQSDRVWAARVVRYGQTIRGSLASRPAALASVLETVAQAADVLAISGDTETMRSIALDAREQLVGLGKADDATLRALARGYADAGDAARSAETWLSLLQRTEQSSLSWYEARLESLRQLAIADPAVARDAARQFRALHPDYGPPRYQNAFRALLAELLPGEGDDR